MSKKEQFLFRPAVISSLNYSSKFLLLQFLPTPANYSDSQTHNLFKVNTLSYVSSVGLLKQSCLCNLPSCVKSVLLFSYYFISVYSIGLEAKATVHWWLILTLHFPFLLC